jgi:hypothetical protein
MSPRGTSQPISNKVRLQRMSLRPSIGHILVVDDDEAFCYAIA